MDINNNKLSNEKTITQNDTNNLKIYQSQLEQLQKKYNELVSSFIKDKEWIEQTLVNDDEWPAYNKQVKDLKDTFNQQQSSIEKIEETLKDSLLAVNNKITASESSYSLARSKKVDYTDQVNRITNELKDISDKLIKCKSSAVSLLITSKHVENVKENLGKFINIEEEIVSFRENKEAGEVCTKMIKDNPNFHRIYLSLDKNITYTDVEKNVVNGKWKATSLGISYKDMFTFKQLIILKNIIETIVNPEFSYIQPEERVNEIKNLGEQLDMLYQIDSKFESWGHNFPSSIEASNTNSILKNISYEQIKSDLKRLNPIILTEFEERKKTLGMVEILFRYEEIISKIKDLKEFQTNLNELEKIYHLKTTDFIQQKQELAIELDSLEFFFNKNLLSEKIKTSFQDIIKSITFTFSTIEKTDIQQTGENIRQKHSVLTEFINTIENRIIAWSIKDITSVEELQKIRVEVSHKKKNINKKIESINVDLSDLSKTNKVKALNDLDLLKNYKKIISKLASLKSYQTKVEAREQEYLSNTHTLENDIDKTELKRLQNLPLQNNYTSEQKKLFEQMLQELNQPTDKKNDLSPDLQIKLKSLKENIERADNILQDFDFSPDHLKKLAYLNEIEVDLSQKHLNTLIPPSKEVSVGISLLQKYEQLINKLNDLKTLEAEITTVEIECTAKHRDFNVNKNIIDKKSNTTQFIVTEELKALHARMVQYQAVGSDAQNTMNRAGKNLHNMQKHVTEFLSSIEHDLKSFSKHIPDNNDLGLLLTKVDSIDNIKIRTDLETISESILKAHTKANEAVTYIQLLDCYTDVNTGIKNLRTLVKDIKIFETSYNLKVNELTDKQKLIDTNADLKQIRIYAKNNTLTVGQRTLYQLMLKSIEGAHHNNTIGLNSNLKLEFDHIKSLLLEAEDALKKWPNSSYEELNTDISRIHELLYPKVDHNNLLIDASQKSIDKIHTHLNKLDSDLSDKISKATKSTDSLAILREVWGQSPHNDYPNNFSWGEHDLYIRTNLLHHLTGTILQNTSIKGKISGTHSLTKFNELIKNSLGSRFANGGYYEIDAKKTDGDGITTFNYTSYDLSYEGGPPVWYKNKSGIKTVYDPKILSDVYIQYYGLQAVLTASNNDKIHASKSEHYTINNIESGGILFNVSFKNEFDLNNNFTFRYVTSVYPVKRLSDDEYDTSKFVSKLVAKKLATDIADIYNQIMSVDAQEHLKQVSQIIETGDKETFWNGYNQYETITIPGYRSDLDRTLADLYVLTYEKLSAEQLGALTRRIHDIALDPKAQFRARYENTHAHSYKVFDQHFSPYEDYRNGDYSNSYLLSQRLLLADNNNRKNGYCYALSRVMSVILANEGIEKGKQFLKKNLYQAVENDRALGKNETENTLTHLNKLANEQHRTFIQNNGPLALKTLDQIKKQLISETKTTLYELNSINHAMAIGVTVNDNKRQYIFYDPEHGIRELVESGSVDNFFKGIASFLADDERRKVYGAYTDSETDQFEFIRMDTDSEAKNRWTLDFNKPSIVQPLQSLLDTAQSSTDIRVIVNDTIYPANVDMHAVKLIEKHGASDSILQLKYDSDQLLELTQTQNDIRKQIQQLTSQFTADHLVAYTSEPTLSGDKYSVHCVHRDGDSNKAFSVDISKQSHPDLIRNIQKARTGYKKFTRLSKWVYAVNSMDDTIGYISMLNQYRALIQGELLHPNATLEHQLIIYGQLSVANGQVLAQLTTYVCQYLHKVASTPSKANLVKVANIAGKASKILPVIGVVLEGGSFAFSVKELINTFNDSQATDLQKNQVISNVALGGTGLVVSVITVGAMLAGASVIAGAATGVGLALIPVGMLVNTYFQLAALDSSVKEMSQYLGELTRAHKKGIEHDEGMLQFAYGTIVKKIDLKNGSIQFGTQSISGKDIFQHVSKTLDQSVSTLVLPTTLNQELEYTYEHYTTSPGDYDKFSNERAVDADGSSIINALSERGLPIIQITGYINITNGKDNEIEKTSIKSISGLKVIKYLDTHVEVFLNQQVKQLYVPKIAELAHNRLIYTVQGAGGQYTLTLVDKVRFLLSENVDSSSTWILDSSGLVENDDIQIKTDQLIIGNVKIDVSKLTADSKLIIQRKNGDVCTINLKDQTKTLNQINGNEYEKRKNDFSSGEYTLPAEKYLAIKNYHHNGKNLGNAYYNTQSKQLFFSIPTCDYRPAVLVKLMSLLDNLANESLYEIEYSTKTGTSTQATCGSGGYREFKHSGYAYALKERKKNDILKLKAYIEQPDFKNEYHSLYQSIDQWLTNYDTSTQKSIELITAQSTKWDSNVKVTELVTTIINESKLLEKSCEVVNYIKHQHHSLLLLNETIRQKNDPLQSASLGNIDTDSHYFFNIKKGLVWRTDLSGAIQEQYLIPLALTHWDYQHIAIRKVTNPNGEQILLLDVVAHSRTGDDTAQSRSLTYQIGINHMDLVIDYTSSLKQDHSPTQKLFENSFEFHQVPKVQWKNSATYVHYYNETIKDKNYWILNGQRVYADLPANVDIETKKIISVDCIKLPDGKQLFYFYDKKSKKLYQQEGDGSTYDLNNPKAQLINSGDQKITSTFIYDNFVWVTDEQGVTYQVEYTGMIGPIVSVTLNEAWLSANGKTDWVAWIKSDLLKNVTEKSHLIRIHGIKSSDTSEQLYAWYENKKLLVVNLAEDLSFIGLNNSTAYLFNNKTGKLYKQMVSEIESHTNDLVNDGYTLKSNAPSIVLLANWTFSKVQFLDAEGKEGLNKILSLTIKTSGAHEPLFLWNINQNKKTLNIKHPQSLIESHLVPLLNEIDAIILDAKPNEAEEGSLVDIGSLLTPEAKLKLITINYQNTRTNKTVFDYLRYTATPSTKFGLLNNDLYITDDRGTIHLKNVFKAENQADYQQLRLQIIKSDSTTFSKSIADIAQQLDAIAKLNPSSNFYQLSEFVSTDQLVVQLKDRDSNLVNEIYGLQGDSTLYGGDGQDVLYGEQGSDKLLGGDGDDVYVCNPGDGHDLIDDTNGVDVIQFLKSSPNIIYTFNRIGNDLIINYGNDDQITVCDHFDVTKDKSIEGVVFQNNGLIYFENASEWEWTLSDNANFKKEGDDLWMRDNKNTFILKNVFSSNLNVCTNLQLDIVNRGKYAYAFSFIEDVLTKASTRLNKNANEWYNWISFLKDGLLISYKDAHIDYTVGLTDEVTIQGDTFANKLYSSGDKTILNGKQGNDELYGHTQNDTYYFTDNDGEDIIFESGGTDTLEFSPEVDIKELQRDNQDLIIFYGHSSSIRIKHHFKTTAYAVEYLKLSNGTTYQISDLTGQAVTLSNNSDGWTFTIGALTSGNMSSVQVDVDNPFVNFKESARNTYDFSSWQGPEQYSEREQALQIDLKKALWRILNEKKEGIIANHVQNIIGSKHSEHFIGNEQDNTIYGAGGHDVFVGEKGNDVFVDGTSKISSSQSGGSRYVFTNGDGNDEIWDWGGSDTIQLQSSPISKPARGRQKSTIPPSVSFLRDGSDLMIKYNNDQDSIRVHSHFEPTRGIEYLEWGTHIFDLSKITDSKESLWSKSYTFTDLYLYKI